MTEITQPANRSELRYAFAPIRDVEFRDASANHDGSWTISGYAAVFDQETLLFDDNYGQVRESIAPGAFDAVLASQPLVHLNFGHDMNRAVAATDVAPGDIGSLELSADSHGLRFMARVDRNDPDAQSLAVKMSRGVVRQASFAFNPETWAQPTYGTTADGREIVNTRIEKIRNLFDVCATPQAAYAQTEVALRSLGAAFGQPAAREAVLVSPETEGESVVNTPEVGDVGSQRIALARARAHARSSRIVHPIRSEK